MADNNNSLHIVVFPWLAFGHLLPFLNLSKTLASRSQRISFVSTPRNIQRLPKIPRKLASLITFVQLPLPQVPNLPSNAEATIDLSYDQVQYLKLAFDNLASPFSQFLESASSSPDLIIFDFAHHWLPPIAAKLKVPCAFFNIFGVAVSIFFVSPSRYVTKNVDVNNSNGDVDDDVDDDIRKNPEDFTVPPKWIPFSSNLALKLHEILKISNSSVANASGLSDLQRVLSVVRGCDAMLVRSCYEFDGEFLRLAQAISKKPVIPSGLLPPPPPPPPHDHDCYVENEERDDDLITNGSNWTPIRDWLDKHALRSVIYVAFGTEVKLNQEEINELALGLESSNLPFFWVLRIINPSSSDNQPPPQLPDGFEERVCNRGLVFKDWAPQDKILAHKSIGGFMNQSGWSSVIEGLANGLPMVVLPMLSSQGLVARIVESKKVGVEVRRNETAGNFASEDVAAALRLLMVDEEGKEMRGNAKRMKEVVADMGLQERYANDLEKWIFGELTVKCNS